ESSISNNQDNEKLNEPKENTNDVSSTTDMSNKHSLSSTIDNNHDVLHTSTSFESTPNVQ
ncbi:unnamed protein product, partial [Rotaria magnacalcarata]